MCNPSVIQGKGSTPFQVRGRNKKVYFTIKIMLTLTCTSKRKLFTWIKKRKKTTANQEVNSEEPKESLHVCKCL